MGRKTIRSFAARREMPRLAAELVDLVPCPVKKVFDSYRPELHYMRGPGPKWHAKHDQALVLDRKVAPPGSGRAGRVRVWSATGRNGAALVLRIAMLAITLVIGPATASGADTSNCGQARELAAARLRWAEARKSRTDPANNDKNCRTYGIHFYEAVTARQAASVCTDGLDRQRNLQLLDSEIHAFNNLIATHCGG